ncbi:MAG TPA: MurR/RpiR family transcriptional regulator [Candidatus Levilactobacillus faecigallinarum]|uniref:MurR/RpiR family transcriptional regulator n=1 Tax=Candidatus Levilactobacillus faecigallinarum TaxID=2838638 RepID=A0A9D1U5M5_9LACO|nr:MurR/RpiR family transcriptional regulator [Candidatus Levilactobacillus faecigallinarum]
MLVIARSALGKLRGKYDSLSATEKKIAQLALNSPSTVSEMTIRELASAAGASTASISRFVKRLGYNNYREFSMELGHVVVADAQEGSKLFKELAEGDSLGTIANKVFHSSMASLTATNDALNENDMARAVIKLINAKTVTFFGLGGSSIAALDGYHKFVRTSLNVTYHPDFDIQLMQASKMTDQDCAVVISHSGKNQETLRLVKELRNNGVPIIGITSYSGSPLSRAATITLLSLTDEIKYRSEGMYSLISQIAILDSLFMMTVLRSSSRTQPILTHVRDVIERTREEP